MKRLFLSFCVIFLLSQNTIGAEPPKNVTIGISDWPPYVDKVNISFGLVPEIVQLSFLQEDIDVDFIIYNSWTACLEALLLDKVDASAPYTSTEERKNKLDFSRRSIIELTTAIFYMRENSKKIPDANLFENQKAFMGLTIGGIHGYFYEDLLKEVKLVYASAPYMNFQKLYLGKVDLVIENELIGWHTLSKLYPYAMYRFTELNNSKVTHRGRLVVRKNTRKGRYLINAFDRGLEKLRQRGIYSEVINKYKENFKKLF